VLFGGGVLRADDSKLAPELRGRSGSSNVEVIIQYKNPPTQVQSGGGLLGGLLGTVTSLLKTVVNLVGGVLAIVSLDDLVHLSEDPNVIYISPNRTVTASADPVTLDYWYPATLADIGRKYGYTGRNVGVAIIDSGIASHSDFLGAGLLGTSSRVVYSQNFVPGESSSSDTWGHGTHVAGLVGGNGAASSSLLNFYTFRGVAPSVKLINLRVLGPLIARLR
jgi:serine protease AprX